MDIKKKKTGNKDATQSFIEDMGINEEMANAIRPIIPKFIIEFIKGVPKFAEEDRRIQEMIQNSVREKGGLLIQNIYSVRTILLTLTGFSLTTIGIILSVLSPNKDLFGHIGVLYGGLVLLGLNVIGSVIYLLYIHTIENNRLSRHFNFDMKLAKEMRDLLVKIYNDSTKTFDNYFMEKKQLLESMMKEEEEITGQNRKKKKDWYAHILSAFFLIGLLLVVISFFWH